MIFRLLLKTSFNFEDEIMWRIFQAKTNSDSGLLVYGKTLLQKYDGEWEKAPYVNVCRVHLQHDYMHTSKKTDTPHLEHQRAALYFLVYVENEPH